MTFITTAYCPCKKCCGKWADGITATGTKAKQGRTIAVDPDVISYGTEVEIDGKTYIAEDRGYGINGNRIDIFFNSHKEALAWGIQKKQVKILEG
jgi:3D (Asp-Asp-Asp) domain-containing protein